MWLMLPIDVLTAVQGLARILQAVLNLQQLSQLQPTVGISSCNDQGVYHQLTRKFVNLRT